MRHVIVDGCDRTGKTTLCKFLSKELNMPIKKFSKPDGNPFMDYCNFLVNGKPSIIDRFYMSEIVYSDLKGREEYIGKVEKYLIESAIKESKSVCIHTTDDPDKVKNRIRELGDDYVDIKEVTRLLKLYHQNIAKSLLHWHQYTIGMDMVKFADLYRV